MADDPLVVFTPSGLRKRFRRGTGLLEAARDLGVDLDSVCGGRGICTRCQVRIAEGEFAKHGIVSSSAHLTPLGDAEHRQRASGLLKENRRCRARPGSAATLWWTCPRKARCTGRSCASAPMPVPSRSIRWSGRCMSRSPNRTCTSGIAPAPARDGAEGDVERHRRRGRRPCPEEAPRHPRGGQLPGHGSGAPRQAARRHPPRLS